MKKYLALIALFVVAVSFAVTSMIKFHKRPAVDFVHAQVQQSIDSLQNWYRQDWMPAIEKGEELQLRKAFLKGRAYYKKIEWAVEYFFPQTARELNGPPLAEVEAEEHIEIPPSGFQVIEEFLYPKYDTSCKFELINESKKLASVCYRLQALWKEHQFRDDHAWTAMRLQLMRIISLGISGFDTPLSLAAITEIEPSLQAIKEVLYVYSNDQLAGEVDEIDHNLSDAIVFARKSTDFNAFDRMRFIKQFIHPALDKMFHLQKSLNIQLQDHGALNGNVASFLDSNAFRADFFIPNSISQISEEKVELGQRLFFDPILSINQKISCASCHQPSKAFTDGLKLSRSADGKRFVKRNAPTLLYAGLQQQQFYDMRSVFLEDQVKNVVENKDEMHGSLDLAAQRLTNDLTYLRLFQHAFSSKADTISEVQVQVAIASYIRSLSPFNSKFDQHLRGKEEIMDKEEIEGFNLFTGKAKCGTCHFMPLFNGTTPPMYETTESEVIGVPADKRFTKLDDDRGRYDVYKIPKFLNAFKTPTLRNVQLTAPYMHNGVFTTLEEVIDFYDTGGALGRNISLENQTLPADPLHLTKEEKRKLVLFLNTLTD